MKSYTKNQVYLAVGLELSITSVDLNIKIFAFSIFATLKHRFNSNLVFYLGQCIMRIVHSTIFAELNVLYISVSV